MSTQKLRELLEQQHDLTERVDRLSATVETQAERIADLESQLAAVDDTTHDEPGSSESTAVDAERASDEPVDADPDGTSSFVARAKRFVGQDSE